MATVSFGGPLEFGAASFGDTVTRNAQNESVPSDAIVTASIAPAATLFSITSVPAYNVAIVDVPLPPGHVGPPLKKKGIYPDRPFRRQDAAARAQGPGGRRARRTRGADVGCDAGRCGGDARNSRRHLGQSGRGRAARHAAHG